MKSRHLTLFLALFIVVTDSFGQNTPQVADVAPERMGIIDNTAESAQAKTARPVPGSSRVGTNPVIFLIGDSTMRNGTKGDGSNGQWGWGAFFDQHFDKNKITVENHALGGTSSRSFYRDLWAPIIDAVRPGDYVIIQHGHNDAGGAPYHTGRLRSSIPGFGSDTLHIINEKTGQLEIVYTYGGYLRKYINDVKEKGGKPIIASLTPRLSWDETQNTLKRNNGSYGKWAEQVAKQENLPFIDLNEISSQKYIAQGYEASKEFHYGDFLHTSEQGAKLNAESAIEGLRAMKHELSHYMLPEKPKEAYGESRKADEPVLFIIGDSTVRNKSLDNKDEGIGWGSVIGKYFNPKKITVENDAMAGRSSRTFMDEGRWQKVVNALRPGDYVLIQFGHNDGGSPNKKPERGTLAGSGDDSKVLLVESTNRYRVFYSYGWYIRKYIREAKKKGATPIVLSHIPRNQWDKDGKVKRNTDSYGQWTKEAAEREGALYIDLNEAVANEYDKIAKGKGKNQKVDKLFYKDHTHTSYDGAVLNAKILAKEIKNLKECDLRKALK